MTDHPHPPVDAALSWAGLPLDEDIHRLLDAQQQFVDAPPDVDGLKQLLVELCRWVVGADGAAMEHVEGDDLVVSHGCGILADAVGIQVAREHSLAGWAVATGQPQLSADIRYDERVDHAAGNRVGAGSVIVHPIQRSNGVTAAVTVASSRLNGLDARDAAVLNALVALAAARLKYVAAFSQRIEADQVLQQQLQSQARSDDLTGLANRRAWLERLSLEMARATRSKAPLCLAILDLDHFKEFNDAHGHQAGDVMLHQTAEAWLHQIRETDLLARMGGEEFALVLPDTPLEAGRAIGKRLLQAVPAGITASAGIARWYGEDADMLYRRADEALYAAKAAGRAQLAVATDDGED